MPTKWTTYAIQYQVGAGDEWATTSEHYPSVEAARSHHEEHPMKGFGKPLAARIVRLRQDVVLALPRGEATNAG